MLVLSRKVGERLLIGDAIGVTIVRIAGGSVRLGIEAPDELPVLRGEVLARPAGDSGDCREAAHCPPREAADPQTT